jgi:hypothetical protein
MRYIQHFSTLLQKISPMNDNSLGKAQSLGLLDANSLVKRNTLKKNDRVDFYSFTVSRSSTVSFKISGLKANADLALLNATGQVITRSKKNGNKPEKFQRGLNAGTYFIQVKSRDGRNTAYQLKATATPVPPLPGGGGGGGTPSSGDGTQSNPIDLGTIDNIPAFRSGDTAGRLADSERFYKFKLAQNSEIKATFSRVSGQTSAFLYADSNGNGVIDSSISEEIFILSSGTEGAPSAFLNIPLIQLLPATGTYFLKVFSANETRQYDLTVAATQYPRSLPSDPGSTEATASDLGTLTSGGTLGARDYVGRLDRTDGYRFNLNSNANVTFTSQVVNGDTDVNQAVVSLFRDQNGNNLVEANDERVFTLFNQIGTNEKPRIVSTSLLAGTYFLVVEDIEGVINTLGHTAYSFSMTAP